MGSAAALSYQSDPRVHVIAAWDGGDGISDENFDTPIMYQRTDGAFSNPQNTSRSTYPEGRDRGLETYLTHQERGLDVMHLTFRATSHIDWNGNGVGVLAGNRWAESVINYYTLAWLDRHLKGRLVVSNGEVVTSEGRSAEEERAFRQSQAQSAYDRLIATRFVEGSIDKFNTSMGLFDPELFIESLDPLYGGNVPYTIEGLWTTNRLATDYRSYCSVSVPDYIGGSDGSPGSAVVASADSGPGPDDMRIHGCPEVHTVEGSEAQAEGESEVEEVLAEPERAIVAAADVPVALPATGGGAASAGLVLATAALLWRRWVWAADRGLLRSRS
uniref:Esterase lipase n=1 Tax=uncultured microorganism TaxID=358574 RepID=A0A0B4ZS65_9ZZZZ|nr:esterase lipase [uncultured microorganism]